MKRFAWFVLLSFVLLLLSACAPTGEAYERVTQSAFRPGDAIPAPAGEVILTVTGKIGAKNSGDALLLDMNTLEKFGLVQYVLSDPWLKEKVTYKGVLMSDFLEIIQADPGAESVHLVALDNYEVDISLREIRKWPVLLATQANGKYMSVQENGPTRIIFPFDQFPDIDQVTYKNLMIWNIASMEVR